MGYEQYLARLFLISRVVFSYTPRVLYWFSPPLTKPLLYDKTYRIKVLVCSIFKITISYRMGDNMKHFLSLTYTAPEIADAKVFSLKYVFCHDNLASENNIKTYFVVKIHIKEHFSTFKLE